MITECAKQIRSHFIAEERENFQKRLKDNNIYQDVWSIIEFIEGNEKKNFGKNEQDED